VKTRAAGARRSGVAANEMEGEKMMGLIARRRLAAIAISLGALLGIGLATTGAQAHGGVKLEQDECVMQLGPNTLHFIGYQRSGEEQEFCQDIAQTGPTVIALSAVSPELRDMAIGVRVVKDVGEATEKANLDAITIVNIEPKVYRNGILTFEHNFKDAGRYVALVTVRDDLGNEWVTRFPFGVGLYTFWGMIEYILYAVGFVSLVGAMWLVLRAKANREAEQAHVAA
jgi:hypothetical protein